MCMRIGIDARMYGPRIGGGGLGRYVSELVTHLQKIDTKNDYVLFLKKENFHECVITNPRFQKVMVDVHWYTWAEQRVLPKVIKRARVDFMHFPHWNIPLLSRVPFIVTIHDLILLEDRMSARSSTRHPLIHGFKHAAFRTALENAIHRSKHIISVSEYTKSSILKHFGIREEKVHAIPIGVTPPIHNTGVSLQKLGVYDPYFLYVGNAYPHKNLEMLMHTFTRFAEQHPHVQLVIAGRRDVFSRALEKEAQEIGLRREQLRFIDLPTDAEIAELYAHAKLFIFPSRIEGFGIPPLEAMQYGTPVAASYASSLPEVLGESVQYFEPDDIERLHDIMYAAIHFPQKMHTFGQLGKAQAQLYSWEKTAKQTHDVYMQISKNT